MFDYQDAFSRNIGWLTDAEQTFMRSRRVAIAGAGGVGGEHAITLARLGVQNFHISDFDNFELHNMNRQACAFLSTLGRPKCDVLHETLLDINPEADIQDFTRGIDADNVDAFLKGADVYVDSLDFFALDARKLVFQKCLEMKIPVVTAAPLGMGAAFLCFMPGGMTYEEYFRFNDAKNESEQLIKFLIGLSPAMLQQSYLVDKSKIDFHAGKGPSVPMSVKMCAGVAGTYVLKILLKRGRILQAPYGLHFDAYKNTCKTTWRPGGNANPYQKLVFALAKKLILKKS